MAVVKIDPLSQVPLFIRLKFGNTELATGTAFFYRRDAQLFLISNWHNFAGRDPKTKQPLADHCGVPDTVSCNALLDGDYIKREWLDIALNQDGKPIWYEHPQSHSEIDVAALPVTLPDTHQAVAINDIAFTEMLLRVSHDVFVLGYPLGLVNPHGLPIWKRASVASEPGGSEPFYLVDTATRSGMSGSPVIVRYRGFYKSNNSAESISADDWFGEGDAFVGVYSGRFGASAVEAQLGIVWKIRLINEVVDGRTTAEC